MEPTVVVFVASVDLADQSSLAINVAEVRSAAEATGKAALAAGTVVEVVMVAALAMGIVIVVDCVDIRGDTSVAVGLGEGLFAVSSDEVDMSVTITWGETVLIAGTVDKRFDDDISATVGLGETAPVDRKVDTVDISVAAGLGETVLEAVTVNTDEDISVAIGLGETASVALKVDIVAISVAVGLGETFLVAVSIELLERANGEVASVLDVATLAKGDVALTVGVAVTVAVEALAEIVVEDVEEEVT